MMKMDAKLLSCENGSNISDEDFIDMEVSSFSSFFTASVTSPPRNNNRSEFEFKMETELTTSPADELFYKGNLLPLHLPPRLQMVEKLLQSSTHRSKDVDFDDELYATPLTATLTTPTAAHTPYESCNISPFESREASRELNSQEYFAEYYCDPAGKGNYCSKKTWTQKLKIMKQSSRAYLKSFFGKSGCSNESSSASKVADEGSVSKCKATVKNVLGQVQKQKDATDHVRAGLHRRSFSLAIRRNSVNKILSSSSSSVSSSSCSSSSSSSSVSNNANLSHRVQFLKRSGSVNSEMEKSIQGAIAHCKRSQQTFCSRKTVSEVGFYSSLSSPSTVGQGHERPEICRG